MAWGSARSIIHKGLLFDGGVSFLQTTLVKNTDENKPVKVSAALTVALPSANDLIDGVVLVIEDGLCSVQMTGFVTLLYSGSAPTVGRTKLESDGAGMVRVDAVNGREYLVTDVDESATTVTFFLG
jgi:hypothetical protein